MLGQRASDRAVGYSRNERGGGDLVKGAIRVEVRYGVKSHVEKMHRITESLTSLNMELKKLYFSYGINSQLC